MKKFLKYPFIFYKFFSQFFIFQSSLLIQFFLLFSFFFFLFLFKFSTKINYIHTIDINKTHLSFKSNQDFVDFCFSDSFIIFNNIIKNPLITIIMPVFNGELFIQKTIKSIQSQSLKEIEILIINDKSSDKSIHIIKNIMKYDKRIKLIQNLQNKGVLFSKCEGILNSKGNYLMGLDQDDVYINYNLFEILYKTIKKSKSDIICFWSYKGLNSYNLSRAIWHNFNNHENFTKLTKLMNPFDSNIYLWNKIIRTSVIKNVAYNLIKFGNRNKVVAGEDNIINFSLLKTNSIYQYLTISGTLNNRHNMAASTLAGNLKRNYQTCADFIGMAKFFLEKKIINMGIVYLKISEKYCNRCDNKKGIKMLRKIIKKIKKEKKIIRENKIIIEKIEKKNKEIKCKK